MFHEKVHQKRRRSASAAKGERSTARKVTAGFTALVLGAGILPSVLAPAVSAAPVGHGLTLNAGDMRFILKQIKIAENHATKEDDEGNPVPGAPLLGSGPNQVANPLLPYGLRTVDGSENNLVPDQEHFGASSLPFPRLADPQWRNTSTGTSYSSKNQPMIYDAAPRFISNVIVDQTPSNPAAIAAAGKAHRTVNDEPTAVPCTAAVTTNCVSAGETLDIPNVTTDFGLSPPYNGMFALFGQFFDHGIDFTKKTNNLVIVPLAPDDPLVQSGQAPAGRQFMVLNRAENQPGEDGILGTEDDVQDGTNTDSPWVDQSQTYGSHASHQVFLREYALQQGEPVSTGELLEGAPGGMATWADVKEQAAALLGLRLSDADVGNIPMLATDQYGRFLRGPSGLPQYVTQTVVNGEVQSDLVEGNLAAPVAPPADVQRIGIAFLDDIAHNASPKSAQTGGALTPDSNTASDNPAIPLPDRTTYDDELLNAHFIAGDGRANENIGLTAIHQVFHSEHNRLVGYMEELVTSLNLDLNEWKLPDGTWNGERLFQAARFVTEMEYQHIVFEDFARKIQPAINPFNVFTQSDTGINPAVMAEFAHATYRFGHSMLTETVDRKNAAGDISLPLLDAFLNPPAYYASTQGTLTPEQAAGAIAMGMTDQVGAEIDEFVTDTLRNNVLGMPLDLATLNITRGRETGVPTLNNFRSQLYTQTGESSLKPYTSWVDYGQSIKHPESVVNFMAAYGRHPSITAAATIDGKRTAAQVLFDMSTDPAAQTPTDAYDFVNSTGTWSGENTGLDDVDLWVGGLAETQNLFGGLLGSTFNYIFERQMTDLQDGDRLYYLSRTSGLNLRTQLEGNSFAELIMRNTDASALKADIFGTADCEFEMANLVSAAGSNSVADDPASACDESALLYRMADGTIRYRLSNTVDREGLNAQATYNGKDDVAVGDRIWGGIDNDTFWGNGGNDVIEGNDGADTVLGGEGNDIVTDSHGDDVLKGGPGNDAIDAGPGLDIIMSGPGHDFSNGGLNGNETFADEGNDLVIAGDGPDAVFGGGGNDWMEGGNANDLLQGDSGAPFFDDINDPGHDVLIGDSGEDDYDAEGGDDIMVAGPGIERNHGVYGFDWVTHARSAEAADSDMRMIIVEGPNALKDRFLLTEALSGWDKDDVLRGSDDVPSEPDSEVAVPTLNNVLNAEGIARVDGLDGLLPEGATEFGAGNIIIGGSGSDQIWGNGADDIIDGDKWLNVRLSVRTDVNDPATQTRTATSLKALQADIMSGAIDPGKVAIVREIITPAAAQTDTDIDTAVFSGARAEYDISTVDGVTTVAHTGGSGDDGTDRITNVEQLRFTDQTVDVGAGDPAPADTVAPTVTDRDPAANATNIAVNGNVSVTFSEAVTGIDNTTFRVTNPQGAQVAGAITYNAATRTATLDPNGNRLANTVYTVELASGIQDEAGNALAATSWTFTTVENTVPTVTDRDPAANATNIAVNGNVSVTFSEPVTGVNNTTFRVTNPQGAQVAGAITYNAATRTATLDPSSNRLANTVYTVRLSDGIKDAAGNSLAATSWTYRTASAPAVAQRTPSSAATNVAVTGNISVTFNQAVSGVTSSTLRVTNSKGQAVSGSVSYNGTKRTATFNPRSSLAANTSYTVRLSNGIKDSSGTSLAATSWSFKTEAAPSVTKRTPASKATNVATNANVSVTFSKAVTGINSSTFRVTNSKGQKITGVLSYNKTKRSATFNPKSYLAAGASYTVRLSNGIKDSSGNRLAATSWSFKTESGPKVTKRTPASKATGVNRNGNISVTFSEAVTGINGTTFRLTASNGKAVSAKVSYNAAKRTATLNPNGKLAANKSYTVRLSNGIKDKTGNRLAATNWSYRTGR